MRVLAIFSNPPDQTPLRLDREDKVLSKLARQASKSVVLERLHASELDDIHTLIIDGGYDVVHISGHGSPDGVYLDKKDLEQEDELVSPSRLNSLLALSESPPRVVILLCCYSDSHLAELSLAAPFVVTARCEVLDEACVGFSGGFYEWLFRGYSVQASYDHAQHLLAAKQLPTDSFRLSRRTLVRQRDSVFIESKPLLERDSILVNLDAVQDRLGGFGMAEEELLHLLSRKLKIHYWIFNHARERAVIPVGRLLFGEFSWQDPNDVIYCTKLMKLRSDIPQLHWEIWCRLLTGYNDLASSEYRSVGNPAGPTRGPMLENAIRLFVLNVKKTLKPSRKGIESLGYESLVPNIEFVISEVEHAEDQLSLGRFPQVVSALERALTNYHEVVDGLQPPEEI